MGPASNQSSYRGGASPRARAVSLLLALAAMVAIVLALWFLGGRPLGAPGDGRTLTTFDVLASGKAETTQARAPARKAVARRETARAPAAAPPPTPVPPVPPVQWPPDMIVLTREQFAASDVGRARQDKGEAREVATASSGGGNSDSKFTEGGAPGGERLYDAEWVREPTRTEMAFYMPKRSQVGWGLIACRTAPRNRVEDCRILGETPGSGIARGVAEAAWQFLVRPPRINGTPQIGVWVRIKFDLVQGAVK